MSNKFALPDRLKYAFQRLRGIPVETDLTPYLKVARAARALDFRSENDGALIGRARALRADIAAASEGRDSGGAMPLCLALAAEACRRRLGLEPYEQQLAAAAAMCAGKVAQLQTGEGKTLAAALAASFCAMRDGCLHILTANDYLALRDAAWMGPLYESLGLSVAGIAGQDAAADRRAAYRADIVYLTARELGFDYLRDGLAYDAGETVQRGFRSAIVDEADFILIDEARVPLVIAGIDAGEGARDAVARDLLAREALAADRAVRALLPGVDFDVDQEGRKVSLTLSGQARIESLLDTEGIHERAAAPIFSRVHAALHARHLLSRDVDYIVAEGSVRLVDAFTGRVATGRRWPWGIQAGLEAKEGLEIRAEGRVYGSIAVQHLAGLYPRLAAMTATAAPAAGEFASAYGMGTVILPPVRPSLRRDEPDAVFRDSGSKMRSVLAEVAREHARGRPVLVGTASVRASEELASLLAGEGIPFVLLNAKNDEQEAALIAGAGQRGAVTISTNMAGRGTDIRLGEGVERLGGLYVVGTAKHESRRIDDQLRGRAGRQGDPGRTRFFVSLEDELFVRYGVGDFLPKAYRRGANGAGGRIDDPRVAGEPARAQSVIEARNAALRRSLRRYSLLVEYDRRFVRELRDEALASLALPLGVEEALAAAAGAEEIAAARPAMARAFIARLDAAWADHLALVEDVKEGMGLFRYGGKDPGLEYLRIVGDAFETAMKGLVDVSIGDCRGIIRETSEGGRASREGAAIPPRPTSTWTYVVEEGAAPGFFDLGALFRAKS